MKSSKPRIKLFGADRFVPQVPLGAEVLGVIERQLQIGALVRLADGGYWQVNGDIGKPLNRSMVERALRGMRPVAASPRGVRENSSAPSRPVVTVRRRRVVRMAPEIVPGT